MGSILGNRVTRVEDPRMLTTGGTYVEDVPLADAAWLTYVRSPYAHAHITGLALSPKNLAAPPLDLGLAAAEYLRNSLMSGFTSIREAGGADLAASHQRAAWFRTSTCTNGPWCSVAG